MKEWLQELGQGGEGEESCRYEEDVVGRSGAGGVEGQGRRTEALEVRRQESGLDDAPEVEEWDLVLVWNGS